MRKISLKNIRFIKNNDLLLSNINLDLFFNENVVIVPEQDKDIRSVQALIKIIAGIYQPDNGSVSYETNLNNRILIGYKNLDHLFKRKILVTELLNTLIKTQNINDDNLNEIKELLEMFRVDKQANTNELEYSSLNLLNLLTLLIIKPHFILIDHLSFPGSVMMQLTILEYIKQYCSRYHINLVISSNDDEIIDIIANRIVVIENTKIINDIEINKINNQTENDIDNATKSYNLEDDILAALNVEKNTSNHYQELNKDNSLNVNDKTNLLNNNEYNNNNYYSNIKEVKQVDQELIYQVTKALDESFDEDIIVSMKNTDEIKYNTNNINNSLTNDLLTIKYETNLDEDNTFSDNKKFYNQKNYESQELSNSEKTTSLNDKFNNSNEFKQEEIKQRTKQLNDDSKDVLEDIKISQSRQFRPSRQFNENINKFDSEENLTNEYMTKGFLAEVKETYAMRKALSEQIKSVDFAKLNPELQHKVFQNHDAADRLIKEIDPEGKYDPDKINSRITKKIINNHHNTKNFQDTVTTSIANSIDDNFSDELILENDDTNNLYDKDNHINLENNNQSNNYQKNKKMNWRERFTRKNSNNNHYYNNDKNRFNNNYNYRNENNDKYITKNYEPESKFNKQKTNVILPNEKKFKTNYFSTDSNEPKRLKTMAIKQRSKRNSIEKLFDEAIEDNKIIKEFKEKKAN